MVTLTTPAVHGNAQKLLFLGLSLMWQGFVGHCGRLVGWLVGWHGFLLTRVSTTEKSYWPNLYHVFEGFEPPCFEPPGAFEDSAHVISMLFMSKVVVRGATLFVIQTKVYCTGEKRTVNYPTPKI